MIRLAALRHDLDRARVREIDCADELKRWERFDTWSPLLIGLCLLSPFLVVVYLVVAVWVGWRCRSIRRELDVWRTIAARREGYASECSYWDALLTDCDPALAKWIDEQYAKVTVSETPTE